MDYFKMVTKYSISILTLLFTAMTFASCESITEGNGYVYSADTRMPIKDAIIEQYSTKRKGRQEQGTTSTDENGYFTATTGLVGCSNQCPKLLVIIKKDGYISEEIINPLGDTIFLRK